MCKKAAAMNIRWTAESDKFNQWQRPRGGELTPLTELPKTKFQLRWNFFAQNWSWDDGLSKHLSRVFISSLFLLNAKQEQRTTSSRLRNNNSGFGNSQRLQLGCVRFLWLMHYYLFGMRKVYSIFGHSCAIKTELKLSFASIAFIWFVCNCCTKKEQKHKRTNERTNKLPFILWSWL